MPALNNSAIQYVGSVEYSAVAAWVANTAKAAGALMRQLATPTAGNERVFVCIVAGTTTNGAEPAWTLTKGAKTTDNTVTWQECTGQPGVNGDTTNSPVWAASSTVVLGQIIYVASNGSLQIVTTSSGNTSGSIPSFSATAGVTTNDGSNVWTSLGAASNFGAWAAPHARVENSDAATWQTVTPAKIYISSTHAQTAAASKNLLATQATAAKPNQYLSVSSATAPPSAVTGGGTISITGNNNLTVSGYAYWEGCTFTVGGSAANAVLTICNNNGYMVFESCTFNLTSTSVAASIQLGTQSGVTTCARFLNCTFVLSNAAQSIVVNIGRYDLINCTLSGTTPTTLFKGGFSSFFTARDCDFSNLGSGTIASLDVVCYGIFRFHNCRLGSGTTMPIAAASSVYPEFEMYNCDSGATNYRFFAINYCGQIDSTSYGAVYDSTNPANDGTNKWSVRVVTSAGAQFGQPYVLDFSPIEWNNSTGSSITATIHLTCGSTLTNAQVWAELEYPGSASYPQGSLVTSRATDALAAGTTLTADGDSWASGLANNYKIALSFTPQMKGPIRIRLYFAVASTTIYVSPMPTISGVTISRTYLVPGAGIVNETSAAPTYVIQQQQTFLIESEEW